MGTGIGVFYGELPHIVKALKNDLSLSKLVNKKG